VSIKVQSLCWNGVIRKMSSWTYHIVVGQDENSTTRRKRKPYCMQSKYDKSRLTIFFWVQPRTYFLNYLSLNSLLKH
jgi:hypothetical protein